MQIAKIKFEQAYDGEWIRPKRKGYLMKCCDCGLVHRLDFRIVKKGNGHFILFKAKRLQIK